VRSEVLKGFEAKVEEVCPEPDAAESGADVAEF
jgi:hypothetical protein